MRTALLLLLLPLAPGVASADEPDGPSGFYFDEPRFSASVRGSRVFARAGSDVFDFFEEQLTIGPHDFDTSAVAGEFGVTLGRRLEVLVGVEYAQKTIDSEYRQFVRRTSGAPIQQVTSLKDVHIGGSLKHALLGRGHEVGTFAWVPRLISPYVGAGAGVIHYRFVQDGDFVDVADRTIFRDVFEARGWAPSAHAFAGVDVKVTRWLYLTAEGRYVWAAGDLGDSFVGFAPMDLSGLRTTVGANVRF